MKSKVGGKVSAWLVGCVEKESRVVLGVGRQGMKYGANAPLCLQSRELTSTRARMFRTRRALAEVDKYASQVRGADRIVDVVVVK